MTPLIELISIEANIILLFLSQTVHGKTVDFTQGYIVILFFPLDAA